MAVDRAIASDSIRLRTLHSNARKNLMAAVIEEATEEAAPSQRTAAKTRPATARVPSPRDGNPSAATVTQVSGIVDLTDGRGYLRTSGYRRSPGDIPLTAISTGAVDSLECILLKMGVDESEFAGTGAGGGGGRIHLYSAGFGTADANGHGTTFTVQINAP